MGRPRRWTFEDHGGGTWEAKLHSWKYFSDFIREHARLFAQWSIFRGHASAKWRLEPSLDRLLRASGKLHAVDVRRLHLDAFKLAARGRRPNGVPELTENEWWALGQHHGLATPLLDWTRSPFVALYFAFEPTSSDDDSRRAVWAFNVRSAQSMSNLIREQAPPGAVPETVDLVEPLSNENARLVNQGGLFTRGVDALPIDEWSRKHYSPDETAIILTRISVPNAGRADCLRYLNAMNINHRSLFPDLAGSSLFCNMHLSIERY